MKSKTFFIAIIVFSLPLLMGSRGRAGAHDHDRYLDYGKKPGQSRPVVAPAAPVGRPGAEAASKEARKGKMITRELIPLYDVISEASFETALPASSLAWISIDGETGAICMDSLQELQAAALTETAVLAAAAAPVWIRSILRWKLAQLDAAHQDIVAQAILSVAEPLYIDEVTFAAATLAPGDLTDSTFDPQLLVENAAAIYETAALLDYVELVETGDPLLDDDFSTTAIYTLAGGDEVEIPTELYYWYVVHPRIGMEEVTYINPVNGRNDYRANSGVFWRTYFLHQAGDPTSSAWLHFTTEHPNLIDESVMDAWAYPAQGFLAEFPLDPLVLIAESGTGRPVLAHYSYPGGYWDGTVIATTLPLEKEYEEGRTALLENLVRAGAASAQLRRGEHRVAIIKERDPWGQPTVESALRAAGLPFDVIGLDGLEALDLEDYYKVIVPSAQPLALYEALAGMQEAFDAWLGPEAGQDDIGHERVLQIHGAIDLESPEDDWCGIVLPGGLACSGQTDTPVDDLRLGGYPKLLDVIQGADILWDGESGGFSGNDPVELAPDALRRIGYFVTQNMIDRCAEIPSYYGGPDNVCPTCDGKILSQTLRSQYPLRTLYIHFGNCGEMQQVLGASGRAALVPVASVDSYGQDHEWNEFNLGEGWLHYESGRSDGGTSVDTRHDQDWGAVMRARGDGYVENATPNYSAELFTLDITVRDAGGLPVDGADIHVASEYNKPVGGTVPLVTVMQAWTDRDGRAGVELGVGHNAYLQVISPAGTYPDPDHVTLTACIDGVGPVGVECVNASFGDVYEINIDLEGSIARPAVTEQEPAESLDAILLNLSAGRDILRGTNALTGWEFMEAYGRGLVDIYVVDGANLNLAQEGEAFTALHAFEDIEELDVQVPVELTGDDLYILLSNAASAGLGVEVAGEVSFVRDEDAADPDDGEDMQEPVAEPEGDGGPQDAYTDTIEEDSSGGGGCSCAVAH